MNNVNGKWVSDKAHLENCHNNAAGAMDWIAEVIETKNEYMACKGGLNAVVQTVSTMMREVERIEKIMEMKRQTENINKGITVTFADPTDILPHDANGEDVVN